MYHGLWRQLPNACYLEWPAYSGEVSVPALARFMADRLRIPDDATLIGSSFGGLIACEIARIRRIRRLILVGSAVSKNEFYASMAVEMATSLWPVSSVQGVLRKVAPLADYVLGPNPGAYTRAVLSSIRMFSACDPQFYLAMYYAMQSWEGYHGGSAVPIRIHGRNDGIIRCPEVPDLELEGGHLIAATHADKCVTFIQGRL